MVFEGGGVRGKEASIKSKGGGCEEYKLSPRKRSKALGLCSTADCRIRFVNLNFDTTNKSRMLRRCVGPLVPHTSCTTGGPGQRHGRGAERQGREGRAGPRGLTLGDRGGFRPNMFRIDVPFHSLIFGYHCSVRLASRFLSR